MTSRDSHNDLALAQVGHGLGVGLRPCPFKLSMTVENNRETLSSTGNRLSNTSAATAPAIACQPRIPIARVASPPR